MGMNLLTLAALIAFWTENPGSEKALRAWYKAIRSQDFSNFAEVKAAFPSADWVKGFIVFDIMGNDYRVIVDPDFRFKQFHIVFIGTHKQYDSWRP